MSLQNLSEDFLYSKLPDGIISLDEQSILRALVGGIQDRLEDIRSYAKKYEVLFSSEGVVNTVVLVTFETTYGKVVTRSLDIQEATPTVEGDALNTWAADELGLDVSQVTSCVLGEDLLRFVDTNTLQYLAATIGAVLYQTAAQSGTETLNQQRILNSYFPRLKIKGTAMSFDILGKLIGFDDVRMTPLWGRLSPRSPNDIGTADNDRDYAETPSYYPQQSTGVAYDPHLFRDGPYFTWTGTVSANPASTRFYSQSVNGFQPWVKVNVTGSVVHPAIGASVILAGGSPHTKAVADVGQGLQFQALGEGVDFNGLEVTFQDWNNGEDRLVSITDRLSTIKYRTSLFDLALTLTDEHAISQFGTTTAKPNSDLKANPALAEGRIAASPYRPWRGGSGDAHAVYRDFVWVSSGTVTPVTPRSQATTSLATTQFKTDDIQAAGQEAVQIMEEVRAATRFPRRSSVGFLNKDDVTYAAQHESSLLFSMAGTTAAEGINTSHPDGAYSLYAAVNGVGFLKSSTDPFSNGTLVVFSDSGSVSGSYDIVNHYYRFTSLSPVAVTAYWVLLDTETVRTDPGSLTSHIYQRRPEDELGNDSLFEVFDEVPWRRDLIGNGELVEILNHTPPVVPGVSFTNVSSTVAVKDHTGADHTVYGLNSTVAPIRMVSQVNPTDKTYAPGQLAIAYRGSFKDLSSIPESSYDLFNTSSTDIGLFGTNSFKLYHAGIVQGVLVADPVSFYGPHHRNGLKLWLPFNEHPDEGAVSFDRSVSGVQPEMAGFTLLGSFSDRLWSDSFGWHLYVKDAVVSGSGVREMGEDYSVSLWVNPDVANGTVAQTLFKQGPLTIFLNGTNNVAGIKYDNKNGVPSTVSTFVMTPGTFCHIAVSLDGNYVNYGVANKSSTLTLSSGTLGANYQPFNGTHTDFLIDCPDRGVRFSDIRVWNRTKTQAELEKVRDYKPVQTVCTYWPTNIEVAGNRDRYGMRVLDNGLITPDVMPPAVRLNQLARVVRYNDEGRYSGENRFNEVGLGGGTPLPPQWKLGQQFYDMTSTGTIVFCTSLGGVPHNALWQFPGNGSYVGLNFNGSTSNGIVATGTSIASSPWPPAMDFNNPAHEFIWIKGDDRKVYEVSLRSTTTDVVMVGSLVARERTDAELVLNGALKVVTAEPTTPHGSWSMTGTAWVTFDNGAFNRNQVLVETDGTYVASYSNNGVAVLTSGTGQVKVYHPQSFRFADQPTGAQSVLVSSGTEMSCNYGGYVYQRYTGGTLSTPPLYLYLTARTLEDTVDSSAWSRWTDNTDTSLYGNKLTPPQPALNANGFMEFENTSDLTPGHYRLTIESGCIGRVDEDFDGFSVLLTIDTVLLEKRLLVGQTGADFTGTDVFEFDYDGYNTEDWLLTIQYLNALTDVNRGTQRNLVVKNYKLERIVTDLYKVSIGAGPAPTLTQVQTGTYTGTNPGGWIAILNSYGTIVSVVHESNIFPSNDTVRSNVPLSSVLTGSTWQRREDHYVARSSQSVLPDGASVAMPTFGGIIVR